MTTSEQAYAVASELEADLSVAGVAFGVSHATLRAARGVDAANADNDAHVPLVTLEMCQGVSALNKTYAAAGIVLRDQCRSAGRLLRAEQRAQAHASVMADCDAMESAIRPDGDGPGLYWHDGGTGKSMFLCHASGPTGVVGRNEVALRGFVAHAASAGVSIADYADALTGKLGVIVDGEGTPAWTRDSAAWDGLGLGR